MRWQWNVFKNTEMCYTDSCVILVVMKTSVSNFRAQNNRFSPTFPPDSKTGFKIVEPSGKILF